MLKILYLIILIFFFALGENLFAAPQIKSAVYYKQSDLIVIDGYDFGEFKDTGTYVKLDGDTKLAINKWNSNQIICYSNNSIKTNSAVKVTSKNLTTNNANIYSATSKYFSIQICPLVALEMISAETGTLKYYVSKYEITQAQYKEIMGYNPSYTISDNLPVNNVKWDDCNNFITKLNSITGLKFKLPDVSEWMGAAVCGLSYTYSGGNNISEVSWYNNNSNSVIHPVGELKPNSRGIFDMSGNAREWCANLIWGSFRIMKGGDFLSNENNCALYYHIGSNPAYTGKNYGFRIMLQM